MKAAVQALGYPSDSLVVIIGQLVNLFREGNRYACPSGPGRWSPWKR